MATDVRVTPPRPCDARQDLVSTQRKPSDTALTEDEITEVVDGMLKVSGCVGVWSSFGGDHCVCVCVCVCARARVCVCVCVCVCMCVCVWWWRAA
jgi:hypothetical protein